MAGRAILLNSLPPTSRRAADGLHGFFVHYAEHTLSLTRTSPRFGDVLLLDGAVSDQRPAPALSPRFGRPSLVVLVRGVGDARAHPRGTGAPSGSYERVPRMDLGNYFCMRGDGLSACR